MTELTYSSVRDYVAKRRPQVRAALLTYNRSTDYVNAVLALARRYAAAAAPADAGDAATKAVAFARAQLGVPYVWGGDGPRAGSTAPG